MCDKPKSDKNNKSEKDSNKKNAAFVAMVCEEKSGNDDWYIDSGAGRHMTPNEENMFNKKSADVGEVVSANGCGMKVKKCGSLKLNFDEMSIETDDILHVPDLSASLLSVYRICMKNNTVSFDKSGCTIRNAKNEVLVFCKPKNGVYKLNASSEKCLFTDKKEETNALTWHRRLGHMNLATL